MTANEIRSNFLDKANPAAIDHAHLVIIAVLAEIAAQLAEANLSLKAIGLSAYVEVNEKYGK